MTLASDVIDATVNGRMFINNVSLGVTANVLDDSYHGCQVLRRR